MDSHASDVPEERDDYGPTRDRIRLGRAGRCGRVAPLGPGSVQAHAAVPVARRATYPNLLYDVAYITSRGWVRTGIVEAPNPVSAIAIARQHHPTIKAASWRAPLAGAQ